MYKSITHLWGKKKKKKIKQDTKKKGEGYREKQMRKNSECVPIGIASCSFCDSMASTMLYLYYPKNKYLLD